MNNNCGISITRTNHQKMPNNIDIVDNHIGSLVGGDGFRMEEFGWIPTIQIIPVPLPNFLIDTLNPGIHIIGGNIITSNFNQLAINLKLSFLVNFNEVFTHRQLQGDNEGFHSHRLIQDLHIL
jgi:hypothetical protein